MMIVDQADVRSRGSSTTIGPADRSSTAAPYGVSEFRVNPTCRGPVEAIPTARLSFSPISLFPLKIPSIDTVGYQNRYATTARWNTLSSHARVAEDSIG